MGFPRQEYWTGLPFSSPGDLSNPEIFPTQRSNVHALAGRFFTTEPPGKPNFDYACLCVKLLKLCLTLCSPMDYSLPDSSVHGVLQARILEWVATPCVSCHSCIAGEFFTAEPLGKPNFDYTMRFPPRHEMRPDSPALHAEQLRFPNQTYKEPRFA